MPVRTAVYPGSFDPVTCGHLDIIDRACTIFDKVLVGVLTHGTKKPLFSVEERVEMLRESCAGNDKVSVESFDGLLVDFLKKKDLRVVIRGLRAVSDLEYEFQIAAVNRTLYGGVETVFFMPSQRFSYLSSSVVREIAGFGGDVSRLVPPSVISRMSAKKARP